MPVSRNSFDASKGYVKVIWNAQNALLDFDFNEAQDILRDRLDRVTSAFSDGLALFGSSGAVAPSATARAVDVTGGIAVSGGQVVRIPTTAALAVFNVGAVGVQQATVYVDWADSEIAGTDDAAILDATYGPDNTHRTKRTVQVLAVAGNALPAPTTGHTLIKLATVTHDFAGGTVILASDIVAEPYGLTAGELGGYGVQRSLRLTTNAPAASDGFVYDTRRALTAALARWRNNGADQLVLMGDGRLGVGKTPAAGKALDVNGAVAASGTGSFGDNVTIAATKTVDGIDLDTHDHSGAAGHGVQVAHATLTGLSGDDHAQYVHVSAARAIAAVHQFAPPAVSAPFTLGANALGQKVVGLNADLLDGLDSTDYARLASAANITGTWQLKADVGLDVGKKVAGIDLNAVRDAAAGIGHNKLSGLAADDHTQYVHLSIARTVAAVHQFAPAAPSAPFTLGANAVGQLVTGLNAERVGGQALSDLDARFVNATTDTMAQLTLTTALVLAGAAVRSDAYVSFLRASDASAQSAKMASLVLSDTFTDAAPDATGLFVKGQTQLTGRAKFTGNLLDTTGAPTVVAVAASASAQVNAVGARALLVFLHVTPDAAYTGTFDVKVYADNNTTSELQAQWTTQSGDLLDRVPWFFINARGDEKLFVQITKSSQTGTAHNFSVALRAERLA